MITVRDCNNHRIGRISQMTSNGRFLTAGTSSHIMRELYYFGWILPAEGDVETIDVKVGRDCVKVPFNLAAFAAFRGLFYKTAEGYWTPNFDWSKEHGPELFEEWDRSSNRGRFPKNLELFFRVFNK